MAKMSYELSLPAARAARTRNMKLARQPGLTRGPNGSVAHYVKKARRANVRIVQLLNGSARVQPR